MGAKCPLHLYCCLWYLIIHGYCYYPVVPLAVYVVNALLPSFPKWLYNLFLYYTLFHSLHFTQFTSYFITTVSAKTKMAHVRRGLDVVSHLGLNGPTSQTYHRPPLSENLHLVKVNGQQIAMLELVVTKSWPPFTPSETQMRKVRARGGSPRAVFLMKDNYRKVMWTVHFDNMPSDRSTVKLRYTAGFGGM